MAEVWGAELLENTPHGSTEEDTAAGLNCREAAAPERFNRGSRAGKETMGSAVTLRKPKQDSGGMDGGEAMVSGEASNTSFNEKQVSEPVISFLYMGKIILAFGFIFMLGGVFTLALENLPWLLTYISNVMKIGPVRQLRQVRPGTGGHGDRRKGEEGRGGVERQATPLWDSSTVDATTYKCSAETLEPTHIGGLVGEVGGGVGGGEETRFRATLPGDNTTTARGEEGERTSVIISGQARERMEKMASRSERGNGEGERACVRLSVRMEKMTWI
ncbi:hypothetical protein Cgig2_015639 [Carnegiea gigantea]|uniref:Uncharacterized protein n=1 Tax=Carnegiea gigantea TaxID=171969 RepID=A0A9Q1K150_9CARY|nr:hypothetical protein Cgig2_015639 [Carnegiea gigantea]